MAKMLKVYRYHDGRHDFIVATTSKKRAIDLLRTNPSSFNGYGGECVNEKSIKAALIHPEKVLVRPLSSNGHFEIYVPGKPYGKDEDDFLFAIGGKLNVCGNRFFQSDNVFVELVRSEDKFKEARIGADAGRLFVTIPIKDRDHISSLLRDLLLID